MGVAAHLGDDTLERLLAGAATRTERETVADHLDACSGCRVLVSELVRAEPLPSTRGDTAPATPSARTVEPGDNLGRLVLVRILGRGGMGRVFEAYDPQLRRAVALKVLSGARSPAARSRLLEEARLLARVEHPNVVTVFDVGEDGARPYLTMEYVRGQHLWAWVRSEDPGPKEVVATAIDAGRGLAAAHRSGVVHRDVKPSNILRTPDGRVVVIDFGLGGVAEDPSSQRPGVAAGTPGYMAPEQSAGRSVDERADQYGLAASCARLLESPAGEASRVPRRVQAVLDRALDEDPTRRFASMEAMVEALERANRSRAPLAAAAVLGVSAIGWAAVPDPGPTCPSAREVTDALWGQHRAAVAQAFEETARPLASETFARTDQLIARAVDEHADAFVQACRETPTDRAEDAALHERRLCLTRQRAVIEQFATTLREDATTTLGRAVETALSLAHAPQCGDPEPASALIHGPHVPLVLQAPVNEARTRLEQAELARQLGRLDEAEALLGEAAELAASVELQALDAEVDLARYGLLEDRGRYAEALEAVERSSHAADASGHDVVAAKAKTRMVYALAARSGRLQDAQLLAPFAEAAAARLSPSPRRAILAELCLYRAVVARLQGRAKQAHRWLDEAEVYAQWTQQAPLDEARLLDERANILGRQGDPSAAEAHDRAADFLAEHLGRLHPAAIFTRAGATSARVDAGAYEAAAAEFDQLLDDLELALGPDHPQRAALLVNQSIALSELRRIAEAEAALREAIALRVQHGIDQGHLIVRPLYALASLLIDQQEFEEAAAVLDRADASFGADGVAPKVAHEGALMRVRLALDGGDPRTALQLASAALERVEALPDPSPVDQFNVRMLLGDARLATGDAADALAEFQQARAVLAAVAPQNPFVELSWVREASALLALGRAQEGLALASGVIERAEGAPQVLASARAIQREAMRQLEVERG